MSVMLSERAAQEVKKIMEDQKMPNGQMLRIGVAGGGCSGFQYALGFDDKFDEKIDAKREYHGVTVAPPTDPNLLWDTRAALDSYATNPRHIPIAQFGRDLSESIVAVDFEA